MFKVPVQLLVDDLGKMFQRYVQRFGQCSGANIGVQVRFFLFMYVTSFRVYMRALGLERFDAWYRSSSSSILFAAPPPNKARYPRKPTLRRPVNRTRWYLKKTGRWKIPIERGHGSIDRHYYKRLPGKYINRAAGHGTRQVPAKGSFANHRDGFRNNLFNRYRNLTFRGAVKLRAVK